jgi:hypothetical protein
MDVTQVNEEVDQLLFSQVINMIVEVIAVTADRTKIVVNGPWLQSLKDEMLQKFWRSWLNLVSKGVLIK